MWQKLSLRARLNTLLALLLFLGLVVNVARLLLDAAPRVRAEDQSVVRLARGFIETLVSGLNDTPDPDARLNQIVEGLKQLRHVSITHLEQNTAASISPPASAPPGGSGEPPPVPDWFVSLIHPEQTTVGVPVVINGRSLGSLVITSHPNDEIAEIWQDVVTQIEVGSAIAAALLLITMTVVSRALQPIEALGHAMTRIEAGFYDTRVRPGGSPELAAICRKLNQLASVLGATVEDKQRLAERVVSLQDAERKEIARDLHDEFGPHLFALRAHASALTQLADTAEPNPGALPPAQPNPNNQAAAVAPIAPIAQEPAGGQGRRRGDAFDPALNPNAPGAPRALGGGQLPVQAETAIGAPGGRGPGEPLDLAHTSGPNSAGALPPPPPRNTNAAGALTTLPPSATPKDEFDLGIGYIQRRDYALAEETMRSFVKKFPSDPMIPDAQFWLGESFFQRQQYRDAAESFLAVTTKFDKSAKAPDALLRLGQSLAALKEKEAACAAFGEVTRKYPHALGSIKQAVDREQKRVKC